MTNKLSACGIAVAICTPASAVAQQAARTPSPPAYVSAFADYKPYRDIPIGNWRAVNDAVAPTAGGNTGHAMPARPAPAASAPVLPGHDASHHRAPGITR